jgi:hypothetical protein
MVPIRVVALVAAMVSIERMEESAQEVPIAGVGQPGMGATSSTETVRPVPGVA